MKKFLLFLTLLISAIGAQATTYYKLVTSDSELKVGANYIIVAKGWYTLGTAKDNNFEQQKISDPVNDVISIDAETIKVITLESSSDPKHPYQLKVEVDGISKYLYAAGGTSKNYLRAAKTPETPATATASISIAAEGSAATIQFNNDGKGHDLIRYNSNSSLFSCYSSGQADVYLYKKVTSGEDTKIATSISFEKASYTINLGDTFTSPTPKLTGIPEGATISWKSSNTDVATVDAGNVTLGKTAGDTKITATYAGDDTHASASASFTLTVIDPNNKSVTDVVTADAFNTVTGNAYTNVSYTSTATGTVYSAKVIIETNSNTFRINDSSKSFFCVSTAPTNYRLSKIVLHKVSGSKSVKIYASTTAYTAAALSSGTNPGGTLIKTTGTANGDYTIDFTTDIDPNKNPLKDTNYVAFYVVGPGTSTNFSSIDVTWEPTASEGEITKDPALSFDASVSYATLGEDFVEPTLSTATGVKGVEYSSSDSEIASVNAETGEVTPIKVGTVTITAKKEADEDFDAQEVKYELHVLAAETYASSDDMSNRNDLTNNTEIVGNNIQVGDATIYFNGTGASSKTKYFLNEGIRFYAQNSLTVTAPEGKYLTKVTFIGISQGGVSSLTPSYGTIDTENKCWICNREAQNSVVLSNSEQLRFKGIIIEYSKYKLAHGESTSESQVTFLENTNSNNNLQLYGAFTPSTSLTVDSYVIRVNGIEATTIAGTADDFTLTGLPYIKDAKFTIAPVVEGVELPAEALDYVTMGDLNSFKYEFIGNELVWVNDTATKAPYQIGAILYFASAFVTGNENLNYLVEVAADGYEGLFDWADGGFTYSIANVLSVNTLENGLPKVSDVDPAPEIIVNLTPSYRFNYDAKYSSLLTSEAITSAPARAAEQLTQIYTCDPQQLNCEIDVTQEVSGVEGVTVDANAPVEFFNLQGVRVDGALAPGIYIRRQGQAVSKVRIN